MQLNRYRSTVESLKIIQHNVANWKSNKNNLANIYKEINPDIVLLNSHGTKTNEEIKLFGYITHKINNNNELHDGSAILVKSDIMHKIKDDFLTDILQITIETNTGPINIATTYLPPRRPYLPFPDFHILASNSNPTYIIGDLNAKHHILGDNYNNTVGKALKIMIDNNKLKHIGPDFPTYISHNSHTSPDIILTNNCAYHNHIIEAGPITSSDHIPVILTITAHAHKIPTPPTLNYRKANWKKFGELIQNNIQLAKPKNESNTRELDNNIDTWYDIIQNAMDQYIPKKSGRIEQKAITNSSIKSLQFYLKNIRQEASERGWTMAKYTVFRLLKQKLIKECKHQSNINWENKINNIIEQYKTPNTFWDNIRKLKGNKSSTPPYIIHNNMKIYTEKEKEKIFRDIWKEVFHISPQENEEFDPITENMVNTFLDINNNLIKPYENSNISRLDSDHYLTAKITKLEILNTIKKLKNNTPGESKINKTILLHMPEEAILTLIELLNTALSMGYFPSRFKHARIKLIPKQNKTSTDPKNYRPISLLEVPGKLFEKIINKRLRTFLETNKILPESQHGFRTARSTETAIGIT